MHIFEALTTYTIQNTPLKQLCTKEKLSSYSINKKRRPVPITLTIFTLNNTQKIHVFKNEQYDKFNPKTIRRIDFNGK